jgi:hypothetical protein
MYLASTLSPFLSTAVEAAVYRVRSLHSPENESQYTLKFRVLYPLHQTRTAELASKETVVSNDRLFLKRVHIPAHLLNAANLAMYTFGCALRAKQHMSPHNKHTHTHTLLHSIRP